MLDRCVGDACLQRGGKVLHNDDGLGPGVLELVLQLSRCIERVHVHHHETGAQDGRHGHWILRHVGHHDGNAVALVQAQRLQIRRQLTALGVGLGVGDVLAHEAVGRAAGIFPESLLHQLDQRCVLRWVNIGGNARRISAKPRSICHAKSPANSGGFRCEICQISRIVTSARDIRSLELP
ncbi:hypothetical protein SDC9_97520 [bioreactor metagenome]|uniref:Uncharacterized protein n=1 Tax=bioreactor metagenome TaxID=1076179 RepID=A0A645ACN0_9ZZZZ